MKFNPNKGYRNDWIDLCMDGRSNVRRIKGKDKKMMQTLTRKRLELDLRSELIATKYADVVERQTQQV